MMLPVLAWLFWFSLALTVKQFRLYRLCGSWMGRSLLVACEDYAPAEVVMQNFVAGLNMNVGAREEGPTKGILTGINGRLKKSGSQFRVHHCPCSGCGGEFTLIDLNGLPTEKEIADG